MIGFLPYDVNERVVEQVAVPPHSIPEHSSSDQLPTKEYQQAGSSSDFTFSSL